MITVQLRYRFRLCLNSRRRSAPAGVFGCARVVFDDALRARGTARAAGLPFISSHLFRSHLFRRAVQGADGIEEGARTGWPGPDVRRTFEMSGPVAGASPCL
ncbi:helix-turn-helix domain-containing protein [Streptomyces sp. NRRL WC-3742]|uniref:helix-turn-helix domain-containing protein n=1 Tax=Streptomyces sp. NRRL WC-3742 TaxID=1463934 RepID=UPI00099CE8EC|nr:helix-turn-helix domain-containing protein [Streptomyces sp. NRRL WC-3742]